MQAFEQPFEDNRELPLELWNPDALFDAPDTLESENTGRVSGSLLHRAMFNTELLSDEEREEYIKFGINSAPQNDAESAAEAEFVTANLRLAAWFVRQTMNWPMKPEDKDIKPSQRVYSGRYYGNLARFSSNSLEYEDRLQLAAIGLINAARKGQQMEGYTTYMLANIEGEVGRGLESEPQRSGFKVPLHVLQILRNIEKAEDQLGDKATDKWVARDSKVKVEQLPYYRELRQSQNVPIRNIDDPAVADLAAEIPANDLLDATEHGLLAEAIDEVLGTLSTREATVIKLRFGFVDYQQRTLKEIGDELGITPERVRQIFTKAMGRLRHPSRSELIEGYLQADRNQHAYELPQPAVHAPWTGRQHKKHFDIERDATAFRPDMLGSQILTDYFKRNSLLIAQGGVEAIDIIDELRLVGDRELGPMTLQNFWNNNIEYMLKALDKHGPGSIGRFNMLFGDLYDYVATPETVLAIRIPEQFSSRMHEVGAYMHTGTLRILGSVGNNAGFKMTGGSLEIEGNAGNMVGNRASGTARIYVSGNVKSNAGMNMSGEASLVVGGTAGPGFGLNAAPGVWLEN